MQGSWSVLRAQEQLSTRSTSLALESREQMRAKASQGLCTDACMSDLSMQLLRRPAPLMLRLLLLCALLAGAQRVPPPGSAGSTPQITPPPSQAPQHYFWNEITGQASPVQACT